ncbi:MAG: PQQ-binding-like beta-propeller repeat protein, partial [Planctomycetota bacterium]
WAGNWAHWRGDAGNGVSLSAQPPTSWSNVDNVRWKTALPGRGSSSPIVWENQIFLTTAIPVVGGAPGELSFRLLCFDRRDGSLMWQKTAIEAKPHEGTHSTNGYASASPCTDGQRVYASFGSRGIYCYDMDGQLIWQRDLGDMITRASFGEGSSPTIVGDLLIVPWDHEGPSFLFALDKRTGKTRWDAPREEPSCWATPLAITHNGRQQIVMNGQNFARSYDAATGEELWRCGGQTQRPVASPVATDDLVLIGSGFRGAFLGAFRLDGRGDVQGTEHVAWKILQGTPDIASPLLSEGRLYFYKGKSGILSCLDAVTGQPHYFAQRTPLANIYASPIAAGGHVYLTDRNGRTVVIEDSTDLKVVATNELGETVDATPAPVDQELIIRGENHLFCIFDEAAERGRRISRADASDRFRE